MSQKKYTFVDLFAGCGGLSEGFYKNGYKALLHLEIDPTACKTLCTRMKHYKYSDKDIERAVLCKDITDDDVLDVIDQRVKQEVDIIIGGPPCQAYSSVGRAQSPDSMNNDPRNYLFENYLLILNHLKPKMFIFENVKGILSAHPNGVRIFPKVISEMRKTYKVIDIPEIITLNAADYGVPQIRERVILIGVRNDISEVDPLEVYKSLKPTHSETNDNLPDYVTVRQAITDLPRLEPGQGDEIQHGINYDIKNDFLERVRNSDDIVYNHQARIHNDADRERYRILSEHQNWQLKDLQEVRPDLIHHDPKHFGNRYTVQEYDKPGRTVVAHLYKDGNLFIHPDSTQARTFTVREAARIQSFPDDFVFEGSRTDQYKQVGNAVPPLMAQAFAETIRSYLNIIEKKEKNNDDDK